MRRRTTVAALILPLLSAACATTATFPADGGFARRAEDTPLHFVTVEGAAGVGTGCASPLVDPRDKSRIGLIRSGAVGTSRPGDYAAAGRYGVRPASFSGSTAAPGA